MPKTIDQDLSHDFNHSLLLAGQILEGEESADFLPVVAKAIDSYPLNSDQKKLVGFLGSDDLGKKFMRNLMVDSIGGKVPGGNLLQKHYLQGLYTNSDEGLQVLKNVLDRLPKREFKKERSTFILQMGKLKGKKQELQEITLKELQGMEIPLGSDNSESVKDLFQIYQVFLENTRNEDEAIRGSLQVITNKFNQEIRQSMVNQFLGLYPEAKNRIVAQLRKNNL